MTALRPPAASVVAVALVALDALVRVAGGQYAGATVLLLGACGVALLPFLPRELGTPSLQAAPKVPVRGLVSSQAAGESGAPPAPPSPFGGAGGGSTRTQTPSRTS